MKIASTTLASNNEAIIEDALRSVVDWVDMCIVIDTGITDSTLIRASEVAGAKLRVAKHAWQNNFSLARNFALEVATQYGADWAMTLDTDERINKGDHDIRTFLAKTSANVVMIHDPEFSYQKERFFRLPAKALWKGPTHECFEYTPQSETLHGPTFSEVTKAPEEWQKKFKRDIEILEPYTKENPTDPRWFYYLGESYKNSGDFLRAVEAYDACAALRGWNEESAWACYQAADLLSKLGKFQDAIDRCTVGLARHAGIAELAWLASYINWYKLGDHYQAIYWARISIAMGRARGFGATVQRIGFRNPYGLYEGPLDVLRAALRAIGDVKGANEADRMYAEAIIAHQDGK